MSGSGISWAICKSAPRSRQITMPALHYSSFYRPDALPAAQPTASKHWRQSTSNTQLFQFSLCFCNSRFVHFSSFFSILLLLVTSLSSFLLFVYICMFLNSICQWLFFSIIIGGQLWWLFISGSLPLSNLYMYLLCSDMVNKLLSLSLWSCLPLTTVGAPTNFTLIDWLIVAFSALTCWLGGRKGIQPVKNWVVRCCLAQGADLHMAQLMPLPLTVSCFSKIQIGFTFLVPAHPNSPGKRAVKRVCVCVCVRACVIDWFTFVACCRWKTLLTTAWSRTSSRVTDRRLWRWRRCSRTNSNISSLSRYSPRNT